MLRALFVDLGGVVLEEGYIKGVRAFAQAQGFNPDKFYAACHDGKYWKDFTLGFISEETYYQAVQANFTTTFDWRKIAQTIRDHAILHNDVYDLLKALKGRFILGTISNHPAEWFVWEKNAFHLEELFQVEAVSGLVHVRKPDLRIFQYALDQAGVKGEEALYIDDSDKHFEGAQAVGMYAEKCANVDCMKNAIAKLIHNLQYYAKRIT